MSAQRPSYMCLSFAQSVLYVRDVDLSAAMDGGKECLSRRRTNHEFLKEYEGLSALSYLNGWRRRDGDSETDSAGALRLIHVMGHLAMIGRRWQLRPMARRERRIVHESSA